MGTTGSSWAQTQSSQIAAVLRTTFKNDPDALQERIAMVIDGTSWHRSDQPKAPANVYLSKLPPYAPELNPIENLWHYFRSHFWSNRFYPGWEDLMDAAVAAMDAAAAAPELIKSVCAAPYLTRGSRQN